MVGPGSVHARGFAIVGVDPLKGNNLDLTVKGHRRPAKHWKSCSIVVVGAAAANGTNSSSASAGVVAVRVGIASLEARGQWSLSKRCVGTAEAPRTPY